ncbi:MAG: S8 family serine peptidase, partial [Candidatus Eremiobacteraeota bacterium]|nr:S8 family serine peptidase [Candidatus Eremiobacteraeota bacterium]
YAESVLTTGSACGGTQVVTPGNAAVQDQDGHGTNVAGIATAIGNDAAGFAGVAWNVKLQVYRIFANGNACTTDEAKAIYDAVAKGANVINLSLGSAQSGGPDQAERDAITFAIAHNVLVVAASGNERTQGNEVLDFPAEYPGVLSVGASALNDNNSGSPAGAKEYVASYSNSGPGLGLVAPGGDPSGTSDTDVLHWISNLYSTTGNPPCSKPADCYVLIAGTSQATPHVTGAAALLLSINPALSPAQLSQILESTADDIGDVNQGHGRLNVYRALAAASGDASPPAYKPVSAQFIAFAYSNSGANNSPPQIIDDTFSGGILVNPDGTFRIADIPPTSTSYKIGVWYDANGNGIIDAGDRFAATGTCGQNGCPGGAQLSPSVITASPFALP